MIKQLLAEHIDLVPRLYENLKDTVLLDPFEQLLNFGGEGSGNFDHEGRPGEVGGSGEGGGGSDKAQPPAQAAIKFTPKDLAKIESEVKERIEGVIKYNPDLNNPAGRAEIEAKVRVHIQKQLMDKKIERAEKAAEKLKNPEPKAEPKPEIKSESKVDAISKVNELRDRREQLRQEVNKAIAEQRDNPDGVHAIREKYKQDATALRAEERALQKGMNAEKTVIPQETEKNYTDLTIQYKADMATLSQKNADIWKLPVGPERSAAVNEMEKAKEQVYAKYDTSGNNERSEYHLAEAAKLSDTQIRSELETRFGSDSKSIPANHLKDVYASVAHNEEILGKEHFNSIVQNIKAGSTSGDACAYYHATTRSITINTKILSHNLSEWNKKDENEIRFHPYSGTNVTKSIIDHEIGHGIHFNLSSSNSSKVSRVASALGREGVGRLVSGYAQTNGKEFAAEAWSAHLNNGNANPAIQYVAALMQH